MSSPKVIQWLLDTRSLWVVPKGSPKEEVASLNTVAHEALSYLSPEDQASVLRFYHVKDAKMCLASHLLKHLIITRYAHVPWSNSTISRDKNGKPIFISPKSAPEEYHVEFNVSHQAGIVSLIAVIGKKGVSVGTDVVCVNERELNDYRSIEKEGFNSWVGIHGDVFSDNEVDFMKNGATDLDAAGTPLEAIKQAGKETLIRSQWRNQLLRVATDNGIVNVDSNLVIDLKLRRFYAMWCLRETYVKMTGEALLASWLKELEISHTLAVVPSMKASITVASSLEAGGVTRDYIVKFKGSRVNNVNMELTALGSDFMVGGAISVPTEYDLSDFALGAWAELDLEKDVMAYGKPI